MGLEHSFVMLIVLLLLVLVSSQRWHASYEREKKDKEKYMETYVMNLREREEHNLGQQGFISFVRFLFLLSILGSFIRGLWNGFILKVNLVRGSNINLILYKIIRKY